MDGGGGGADSPGVGDGRSGKGGREQWAAAEGRRGKGVSPGSEAVPLC